MELYVEYDDGRARTLPERRWIGRLDLEHVEEPSEHRVHGQERRRHPAAPPQEITAAYPAPRRQPARPPAAPLPHPSLRRPPPRSRKRLLVDQPLRARP